jgi:hypothetical protein
MARRVCKAVEASGDARPLLAEIGRLHGRDVMIAASKEVLQRLLFETRETADTILALGARAEQTPDRAALPKEVVRRTRGVVFEMKETAGEIARLLDQDAEDKDG